MKTPSNASRAQTGFSLVELMVGMVIGLIAIVIMFQVFSITEGQRRRTTNAGDATQNGAAAIFLMERDMRMAGYGLTYFPSIGCTAHGYNRSSSVRFDFPAQPVKALDGGAKGPDQLTITYGTPATFALPGVLNNATSTSANAVRIRGLAVQYQKGDVIMLSNAPSVTAAIANPSFNPPPAKNDDCWVTQVTDGPPASNVLSISGATYDDNGVTRPALFTLPFALPVNYVEWNSTQLSGGRVFNLGPNPVSNTYSIVNNQFVVTDAFTGQTTPIADNIVQFQVQLGYSENCRIDTTTATCSLTDKAPVVNVFNPSATAVPVGGVWMDQLIDTVSWKQLRNVSAVRVALVARNVASGKKDLLGNCSDTAVMPVWQANNNSPLWVDSDPNWQCYTYRVFEMTMPIRNMIWFADPQGTPVPSKAN